METVAAAMMTTIPPPCPPDYSNLQLIKQTTRKINTLLANDGHGSTWRREHSSCIMQENETAKIL